ncbi:hypothetical protein [Ornithinimicrobium cavernae]|uniref:hypothetical protein n=1 Tax=Ornithinimicrobium cavernae TaxID=2666047 RepID=UPI000D686CD6|nr:hypothetical protein [Ornithinimicrobium cavernae]
MSGTPPHLHLLGLAEELSSAPVHLGDPAAESLLCHLLDRVLDAVVDVTQGRGTLSRPGLARAPEAPSGRPADLGSADLASCSALAAQCHRLAAHLGECRDLPLAREVEVSLRTIGDGLQRLVQDLPATNPSAARQRFLRALRGASARLDAAAPLE